jgi:hypothetical protein
LNCGVLLEFLEEQNNWDHLTAKASTNPPVTAPNEIRNTLRVNRQIVDFNKVGLFDLDFIGHFVIKY